MGSSICISGFEYLGNVLGLILRVLFIKEYGKSNLSVHCYNFNFFYGYRYEDVHACKGIGKEKGFIHRVI